MDTTVILNLLIFTQQKDCEEMDIFFLVHSSCDNVGLSCQNEDFLDTREYTKLPREYKDIIAFDIDDDRLF